MLGKIVKLVNFSNLPRSKSGRKRPALNTTILKRAVNDVINNRMPIYKAAAEYELSKATLIRHIRRHRNSDQQDFQYVTNIDHKKVFTEEEEHELAQYLETASKLHYGLSKKETKVLAYQFAVKKEKSGTPVTWHERKEAGTEWMRGFMKRQKSLSLRRPEATSMSRSTSFNKKNVADFLTN